MDDATRREDVWACVGCCITFKRRAAPPQNVLFRFFAYTYMHISFPLLLFVVKCSSCTFYLTLAKTYVLTLFRCVHIRPHNEAQTVFVAKRQHIQCKFNFYNFYSKFCHHFVLKLGSTAIRKNQKHWSHAHSSSLFYIFFRVTYPYCNIYFATPFPLLHV